MIHSDKELLATYKLGWDDCSNDVKAKRFALKPMQKAYTHGWVDFIAGDDASSVDDQSDEEILAYIRGVKK